MVGTSRRRIGGAHRPVDPGLDERDVLEPAQAADRARRSGARPHALRGRRRGIGRGSAPRRRAALRCRPAPRSDRRGRGRCVRAATREATLGLVIVEGEVTGFVPHDAAEQLGEHGVRVQLDQPLISGEGRELVDRPPRHVDGYELRPEARHPLERALLQASGPGLARPRRTTARDPPPRARARARARGTSPRRTSRRGRSRRRDHRWRGSRGAAGRRRWSDSRCPACSAGYGPCRRSADGAGGRPSGCPRGPRRASGVPRCRWRPCPCFLYGRRLRPDGRGGAGAPSPGSTESVTGFWEATRAPAPRAASRRPALPPASSRPG